MLKDDKIPSVLNVEYCKSCQSHNWCTHHDEEKYFDTFLKLKKYIEKKFPNQIIVEGNNVPSELVAVKPQENKYFNTKTNKYVTFPVIGAFQVTFQDQLIFSKKKTNNWPNFPDLADRIYFHLNGTKPSPTQSSPSELQKETLTEKDNLSLQNQSFLESNDKRTTQHNGFKNKKEFTLTDHFKKYHRKNHDEDESKISDEFFRTQNDDIPTESMGSVRDQDLEFADFKKNFQQYGLKQRVPQFLRKKAYFRDDSGGKKEMIIRLDSIEEESLVVDDPQIFQHQADQNRKNKKKTLIKRFDEEFDQLEEKFRRFEERVENIRNENKRFDSMPKISQKNSKDFKLLNKKHSRNSQAKYRYQDNNSLEKQKQEHDTQQMYVNPIIFARKKLKNIEDYINGTQQEKNQKLKRIYGEWKLLKKPYRSRKYHYVSPYKMQNLKTFNQKKEKNDQIVDSSSQDQHYAETKKFERSPPNKYLLPLSKQKGERLSNVQKIKTTNTKNITQQQFYSAQKPHKFSQQSFPNTLVKNPYHIPSGSKRPQANELQKFNKTNSFAPKSQTLKTITHTKSQQVLIPLGRNLKFKKGLEHKQPNYMSIPTKRGRKLVGKKQNQIKIKDHIEKNKLVGKQFEKTNINSVPKTNNKKDLSLEKNPATQEGVKTKNTGTKKPRNYQIKQVKKDNFYNQKRFQKAKNLQKSDFKQFEQNYMARNSNEHLKSEEQFCKVEQQIKSKNIQALNPSNTQITSEEKPTQRHKKQKKQQMQQQRLNYQSFQEASNIKEQTQQIAFKRQRDASQAQEHMSTKQEKTWKRIHQNSQKTKTNTKTIEKIIKQSNLKKEEPNKVKTKTIQRSNINKNPIPKKSFLTSQEDSQLNNSSFVQKIEIQKTQSNEHQLQSKTQSSKGRNAGQKIEAQSKSTENKNVRMQGMLTSSKTLQNTYIPQSKANLLEVAANNQGKFEQDGKNSSQIRVQIENQNQKAEHSLTPNLEIGKESHITNQIQSQVSEGSVNDIQRLENRTQNKSIKKTEVISDLHNDKTERNNHKQNHQQGKESSQDELKKYESGKQDQTNNLDAHTASQNVITQTIESKILKDQENKKVNHHKHQNIVQNKNKEPQRQQVKRERETKQEWERQQEQANPQQSGNRVSAVQIKNKNQCLKLNNLRQNDQEAKRIEKVENLQSGQVIRDQQKQNIKENTSKIEQQKEIQKPSINQGEGKDRREETLIGHQENIPDGKEEDSQQEHWKNQQRPDNEKHSEIKKTDVKADKSIKELQILSGKGEAEPNSKVQRQNIQNDKQIQDIPEFNKNVELNEKISKVKQGEQNDKTTKQKIELSNKNEDKLLTKRSDLTSQRTSRRKLKVYQNSQLPDSQENLSQRDGQIQNTENEDTVEQNKQRKNKNTNKLGGNSQEKVGTLNGQKQKEKPQISNIKKAQQQQSEQNYPQKQQQNIQKNKTQVKINLVTVMTQTEIDVAKKSQQLQTSKELGNIQEQKEQIKELQIQKVESQGAQKTILQQPLNSEKNVQRVEFCDSKVKEITVQNSQSNKINSQLEGSSDKKQTKQITNADKQILCANDYTGKQSIQKSKQFQGKQIDHQKQLYQSQEKQRQSEIQNQKIEGNPQKLPKQLQQRNQKIQPYQMDVKESQKQKMQVVLENHSSNQQQQQIQDQNQQTRIQNEEFADSIKQKLNRAPIIKQLFGQDIQRQKLKYEENFRSNFEKVSQVCQKSNQLLLDSLKSYNCQCKSPQKGKLKLFEQKSIRYDRIFANHPMPQLQKIIKILCNINEFLLVRLFENPFLNNQKYFGVWLCVNFQWKCYFVDEKLFYSDKEDNTIFLDHKENQLWPMILEKALSMALGGYGKLLSTSGYQLFTILTGSNSLYFNVKQDPSKNGKILKYISDCENKNFIIHGQKICKTLQEFQRKDRDIKIYYILSQKTINENQILIEVREDDKNPFWIKLSKFVQEFKSIEILQLRINHNFVQMSLQRPLNTLNVTIIELDFVQPSFGSIRLSYESPSNIKTYLYKQEKTNILKLIGEAKEKNKHTLFFDCYFHDSKYYVFAQTSMAARLTYLGQNQPLMRIVEEINAQGLRNDYTEYLPIKQGKKIIKENKEQMPKMLNKTKFGETGLSFKSTEDKLGKLRENFVDYLLQTQDHNKWLSK